MYPSWFPTSWPPTNALGKVLLTLYKYILMCDGMYVPTVAHPFFLTQMMRAWGEREEIKQIGISHDYFRNCHDVKLNKRRYWKQATQHDLKLCQHIQTWLHIYMLVNKLYIVLGALHVDSYVCWYMLLYLFVCIQCTSTTFISFSFNVNKESLR